MSMEKMKHFLLSHLQPLQREVVQEVNLKVCIEFSLIFNFKIIVLP
jgi:hypothetical protein